MDKNTIATPVHKKIFPPYTPGASMIGEEELKELQDVIREKSPFRHYGLGNPCKVAEFEQYVREYLGTGYALAVSSGTAALLCAVTALGIGPGDEVILPAFTWFSDYSCIVNAGAVPVFADIDESLNLSPEDMKRKITRRTRAVIVVHYQGGPAKIEEIISIAKQHDIKVIEDCAQAFGGTYRRRKLGTFGDIGITSFQNNKMITCGEGGLLYTDNEEYYARAVRYHDLGSVRDTFKACIRNKSLADQSEAFAGLQFRMSELQGAVILAQARKLEYILGRCRKSHGRIREHFKGNACFDIRLVDEGDCGITFFMRFKTAGEAKNVKIRLMEQGLPVSASSACCNILEHYPVKTSKMAFDRMPPFGKGYAGYDRVYDSKMDCLNANDILNRYVAIPIGPLYTEEDIDSIIKGIEKAIEIVLDSKTE